MVLGSKTGEKSVTRDGFTLKPPPFRVRAATRWHHRLDRLRDWFARALEQERDFGGAFLWMPVWLGVGIAIYYSLPREPLLGAFALVAVIGFAVRLWLEPGGKTSASAKIIALIALGATVAQAQVLVKPTQMLGRTIVAEIRGPVTWVEHRSDGSARVVVDVSADQALVPEWGDPVLVRKVRVTMRTSPQDLTVGSIIEGRARLGPPPGPVYPGGYDFAFKGWFDGIGASGFFLGATTASIAPVATLNVTVIRARISSLIRTASRGEAGGIAAALIVGDRSGIPPDVAEALRRSGLAHILAISGLHMTLVVGTALLVVRTLLSALPSLALNYPIKKAAAAVALLVATLYLGLSGGSVSAQRAFIMVAVMLLAVLFDRRALTMRNVALAALIVLMISPHALLSPGFQMSFAAVAALIWAYEMWRKRDRENLESEPKSFSHWVVGRVGLYVSGLLATALIAGFATGIFAAYHFHRVAPLGLLANLLAMPIVSLLIMPAALLSVLAMPFGLETAPLAIMGFGTDRVVAIARWVSQVGPPGTTGFISPIALVLAGLALLVLTLSRSRLRWFAALPTMLAFTGLFFTASPIVLISEDGKQLGLVGEGSVALLKPGAGKFRADIWRRAYGDEEPDVLAAAGSTRPASVGEAFACDGFGCAALHDSIRVVHINSPERLAEDCRMADVIVAPFPLTIACPTASSRTPILIDRDDLERHGSHAIYRGEDGGLAVSRARESLTRPWNFHWNRVAD
jgi:competence protein ComEC